jgi:hypothetical protein
VAVFKATPPFCQRDPVPLADQTSRRVKRPAMSRL